MCRERQCMFMHLKWGGRVRGALTVCQGRCFMGKLAFRKLHLQTI